MLRKRKKITLITGTLKGGGAERVISKISTALSKTFDIEIVMWYKGEPFYQIPNSITIVSVDEITNKKKPKTKVAAFRKYIKESEPAIIISFMVPFNILTGFCTLGIKVPIIMADRSDPRFAPSSVLLKLIRNFTYSFLADKIVFQTNQNKNYFSSNLICGKSVVIPNPVFLQKNQIGIALQQPKLKKIVSVGRLIKSKNQKMLIDAFSQLPEKYSDYELVIYGSGPLKEELEKYANDLRLGDRVKLPGVVTNIADHISNAKIFVLTSLYEGMPNALIEAMCLGLPVITTNVSGTSDLIKQGVNGYVIENTEELIQRIQELLSNEEKLNKLGLEASRLHSTLNIEIISKAWESLISTTIKE